MGKHAAIVPALCGGKSTGADHWRRALSNMEDIGFSSCKANPDFWIRPALKSNMVEHYQHDLLCTYGILAIMEEPETFLRQKLGKRLTLKEKPIGSLEQCLWSKVSLVALENGVKCCSFSSSQCAQAAVKM